MIRASSVFILGIFLGLFSPAGLRAQSLSLDEFMGFVKQHHPFVKQAKIELNLSETKLLKAWGAFDPKIEAAFKEKTVKNSPYYERLNAAFTLPTPIGMELKAEISEAEGDLLNPENVVSGNHLYAVGADLDLGKGLWANPRNTALKQARRFVKQAEEENRLAVNQILEEASHAFLDWYAAYQQWNIIGQFVENAAFRFQGVKQRVASGDLAPIDSLEARIAYNNRKLLWEKSLIKLNRAALKASNFLWLEDQPIEIREKTMPTLAEDALLLYADVENPPLASHPKMKALNYKIEQQRLEQRLQRNALLPEIKLGYRWLSGTNPLQTLQAALDPENNITQFKVKMPLFLRKERANLKLSSLKLDDLVLAQEQTRLELGNKINALNAQKNSLTKQKQLTKQMVEDYKILFEGEQKKFDAGESSLFLVNSREAKWLDAVQKFIGIEQAEQKTKLSYYFLVNF